MLIPHRMLRLCVFCGSASGTDPVHSAHAVVLGQLLVERGLGLVYGGARVGLMGTLADAVLAAGGEVIGVIPEGLVEREIAHPGLDELIVTPNMHARKAAMAARADAFLALPGGLGTLEELFEVWTWAELGLHTKPCALLDQTGYYAALRSFLQHAASEGFMKPSQLNRLLVASDPEALLDRLVTAIEAAGTAAPALEQT
ncbi:MAG TPA: TIGR00730 family Rossman fold protein [Polyangiaceae bacterium]